MPLFLWGYTGLKEAFNLTYSGLFPLGEGPGGNGMDIKMTLLQNEVDFINPG